MEFRDVLSTTIALQELVYTRTSRQSSNFLERSDLSPFFLLYTRNPIEKLSYFYFFIIHELSSRWMIKRFVEFGGSIIILLLERKIVANIFYYPRIILPRWMIKRFVECDLEDRFNFNFRNENCSPRCEYFFSFFHYSHYFLLSTNCPPDE